MRYFIPTEEADRAYRIDNEFTIRDSALTDLILEQSISSYIDTLSKIDFDRIIDYDKYNRVVSALPNLYNDVSVLTSKFAEFESADILNFDTELSAPTLIGEELKIIIPHSTDLLLPAKANLSEQDYESYKWGLAKFIWLGANLVNMEEYPGKYSIEVLDEIKDVLKKVDILNTRYEDLVENQEGISFLKQDKVTFVGKMGNALKRIPVSLIFFANFLTYAPVLNKILSPLMKGVFQSANAFTSVASQLGAWGDIAKNPIQAMINVTGGIVGVSLAGLGLVSNIYGTASQTLEPTIKSLDRNPTDEHKNEPLQKMFFKSITVVLSSITSFMKGIMNVFVNMIKMGFQMFFNVFTSLVKSLKSIAETSPVFQAIMEYVGLAMNMFFLPFFSYFADPLLSLVGQVVTYVMIAGAQFQYYLQKNDTDLNEHLDKTMASLIEVVNRAINMFTKSIKEEGFDKIRKPLTDFIKSFANTIIDNSSNIADFLSKGVDVMGELLKSGIMETVLELSAEVFQWVIDNKEFFEGLFGFVDWFIDVSLGFVRWVLNNIEVATVAILTAVGTACGAIGGLQAGLAAAWFTFGLSVPMATAVGATLGASAGLASALYVLSKWITPAKDEVSRLLEGVPRYGNGGKIYGRRGGHIGLLGEVGEGEFAIPQSKVDLFRGNNNVVIKFKKGVYNQRAVDDVMGELKQELPLNDIFY